MRWPARIPAGVVCTEPAMTIDLFPTIAAITGAELPKLKIDGKDITPLLENKAGAKSPQEAYYFWWGQELQAVRSGKWKLHFPHEYRTMQGQTLGKDGKPGPYATKKIEESLFDLEADPAETRDVHEKNPEVVKRLKELAQKAREELGDSATKTKGKGVREVGRLE
jgi:arylsulfatase A